MTAMTAATSASFTVSKTLRCQDLHSYLKTLPPATLEKLYAHPATCLAVFREVPAMGRHYIMRLLFVEQAVPQAVVSSWNEQKYVKEHLECLDSLSALHLWSETSLPGGLPGWTLSPTFRANIRIALLGGGQPWSVYSALEKDKHVRDANFLDQYALERWECVLHFMVGCHSKEGISADAVRILLHAGLMKLDDTEGSSPLITTEGFQFLLMDTASQVWYFVLQYLGTIQSRGMDLVECLTFLFQLSFLTLGRDYSTEGMSESLLLFLQHLREFGLVYQRKRRSGRFYPTRLAINLASGLKNARLNTADSGYIVVETNYRVYAYTCSQLQVALLGLFCEMMYRFPNLVVGVITRESVRQALRSGITAQQIINFLQMHAHTVARKEDPVVPPTILDQLRLWELERDRFTFTGGVLYSQFISQGDFQMLRNYASDLGVLIWDNPSKRVMVVSRNGHDDVKRFWKRHRQDH
ncbi:general transcription factor IIH subunit 4-like [Ornithodoros turicata]|uniref:general transcription factor IIH subunit 4-like n=1 Tax=Ornithodoros turicata TaxID=34597 RepID=UPI003139E422